MLQTFTESSTTAPISEPYTGKYLLTIESMNSPNCFFFFIQDSVSYEYDRFDFSDDNTLTVKPRKLFQYELVKMEMPNTSNIRVSSVITSDCVN